MHREQNIITKMTKIQKKEKIIIREKKNELSKSQCGTKDKLTKKLSTRLRLLFIFWYD